MATVSSRECLDLRGRTITTFIAYEVATKLRSMAEGDRLELVTEDREAIERDLVAWVQAVGHTLLAVEREPEGLRFSIVKGAPEATKRKVAFVISDPGLEKLLSPLGFALAAALEGDEVHIYFQGPAVRLLTQGYKAKLQGLGRPFSGLARKGMAKQGHVPPDQKLQQLRTLGAQFYVCGGSMDYFKVEKSDLIFDDLPIAQYLTFIKIMDEAQVHIFLQ
jgi:predicted peroxiredoxin/TusA-related sulfurtransferase